VNDSEFAYRVRQALDEGAERVDYAVSLRLEKARQAALARYAAAEAPAWSPALRLASASGPSMEAQSRMGAWMMRLGLAVPLLALAIGVFGIKQWQNDRMIAELADTDLAVLLDDTPIDTYAHQGFGVYLREENNL
jgi:hypothetical protein